jgi:hypothetical protein
MTEASAGQFARGRDLAKVLWCSNQRARAGNGWKFPPAVRKLLLQRFEGKRILHLFGGHADFGVRLDIDPITRPDVIGDAWLPPFKKNSFDVAILDPPYFRLDVQMKNALLRAAGWVAREHLVWFHQAWIAGYSALPLEDAYLVRVGDNCYCRALQIFRVTNSKLPPTEKFTRGPAIKYNRWIAQPQGLPFG